MNDLAKKILPRPLSYIPIGLFINTKKDLLKTLEEYSNPINEDVIKGSKLAGGFYEGIRIFGTSLVLSTGGWEAAVITYGGLTYVLDTANKFGFVPVN